MMVVMRRRRLPLPPLTSLLSIPVERTKQPILQIILEAADFMYDDLQRVCQVFMGYLPPYQLEALL